MFVKGFRDSLDGSEVADQIMEFLENQFSMVLEEEIRINRNPKYEDNRVHVALYFVRATSRG